MRGPRFAFAARVLGMSWRRRERVRVGEGTERGNNKTRSGPLRAGPVSPGTFAFSRFNERRSRSGGRRRRCGVSARSARVGVWRITFCTSTVTALPKRVMAAATLAYLSHELDTIYRTQTLKRQRRILGLPRAPLQRGARQRPERTSRLRQEGAALHTWQRRKIRHDHVRRLQQLWLGGGPCSAVDRLCVCCAGRS